MMDDRTASPTPSVGQSLRRVDGPAKLTGRAQYVDDRPPMAGELWGRTLRSSIPRGLIKALRLDPAFDWSDVTVVTADDVPHNVVALVDTDQPVLAKDRINHAYEPIALVACADRGKTERALAAITVETEPLPAVLEVAHSLAGTPLIWRDSNVMRRFLVTSGRGEASAPDSGLADGDDVGPEDETGAIELALAGCELVVRGRYSTHHHDQLYIEPQGTVAYWDERGVHVIGSLQCPYYVQRGLVEAFALSPDRAHVTQAVTGGAFGGKEDYPTILALHAALLARKSGRPVRMIYDRTEDLEATTKRHPSITEIATGCDRDGTFRVLSVRSWFDAGAYVTLTPVVVSRAVLHAGGPYRWQDVRIEGLAVATNTPPNGAYRGFGVPQAMWAIERHLDRVARALGRDPMSLKRQNLLRVGDRLPTGQRLRDSVGLDECVRRAFEASDYERKRSAPPHRTGRRVRGIGGALFHHGAGFTGGGEARLAGKVAVDLTADGGLRVRSASTDIGQGTTTVFSQIAADAAGIAVGQVEVAVPSTADVPDSGPTVASRTVMIVGSLVERAARLVAARVAAEQQAAGGSYAEAANRLLAREGPIGVVEQYSQPDWVRWDEAAYKGDAYAAYGWGCDVAEVEVDLDTFEVRVDRFWTAADVGRAIHPTMCQGQLEGGALQAIGWALSEQLVWREGRILNPRLANYIIPTALDAPSFETLLVEHPYAHGPGGGAKGIGELPMDGAAPAVAAAIEHALGFSLDSLPLTPERLFEQSLVARRARGGAEPRGATP